MKNIKVTTLLGRTDMDTDRSVNTDQSVEDVFLNLRGGTREQESSSLVLLELETRNIRSTVSLVFRFGPKLWFELETWTKLNKK